MKKALSLLIILVLLVPAIALASNVPFRLRNGYYWGMTVGQARKLAADEGLTERKVPSEDMLVYESVPLGDIFADSFSLKFSDTSQLQDIYYFLAPVQTEDFLSCAQYIYLVEQLSKVYGDGLLVPEWDMTEWKTADTTIYLFWSSAYENGSRIENLYEYGIHYKASSNAIRNNGF